MYCYQCGKQIADSPDYLCDECRLAKENASVFAEFNGGENVETGRENRETQSTQNENLPTGEMQAYGYNHNGYYKRDFSAPQSDIKPSLNPTDTGFGKALAATIVGVVGFVAAFIAFECSVLSLAGEMVGLAILATVCALGLGVLALVFGVQSIRRFKAFRSAGLGKPVATLVLGIVGVAVAAYALLFVYFSYSFLSCGLAIS
jgi:hypothetical protein